MRMEGGGTGPGLDNERRLRIAAEARVKKLEDTVPRVDVMVMAHIRPESGLLGR